MAPLRLALILHKTPDEVRDMSLEDMNALLYLIHCENKKQEQEAKIRSEMSKM